MNIVSGEFIKYINFNPKYDNDHAAFIIHVYEALLTKSKYARAMMDLSYTKGELILGEYSVICQNPTSMYMIKHTKSKDVILLGIDELDKFKSTAFISRDSNQISKNKTNCVFHLNKIKNKLNDTYEYFIVGSV